MKTITPADLRELADQLERGMKERRKPKGTRKQQQMTRADIKKMAKEIVRKVMF